MYTTSGDSYGYRVYTSENLVDWKCQGYCLRREDVYYADRSAYAGFWAPEIIKDGDTYYMVYTAQEHLGIAVSDSPLGPFTNTETSYLLNDFKNIDGHFFRDDDGKLYLYFVGCYEFTYNGYTNPSQNCIWGGEFSLETRDFVSKPQLLLTWEDEPESLRSWRVVEGPEMLKHNGQILSHLFFLRLQQPGLFGQLCDLGQPARPVHQIPEQSDPDLGRRKQNRYRKPASLRYGAPLLYHLSGWNGTDYRIPRAPLRHRAERTGGLCTGTARLHRQGLF